MRTLTSTNLASTLLKLPAPDAVYESPGVQFKVYRAKNLYSARWNSHVSRDMVAFCRMSYSRYGDRPLFDPYDKKAAIYLVRAVRAREEEWLSLRMVPGDKKPLGVAEPEIHASMGKRLDYWMKKKIGASQFWNHVASSSRMCGIRPYTVQNNGAISFLKDDGHRQTVTSFALAHKQFILDYPLSRFPYRYITAMVRPDFYKKRLVYLSGKRMVRPVHVSASRFLGIDRKTIRVDRNIYSYPFPLYWLDNAKLLALVNKLRHEQHKVFFKKLETDMFSNLTEKTAKQVSIAGIRIEPQKMRDLIDRFVPDAPELKITKAAIWYRGMDAVLRAAKIKPGAKAR